MTITEALQLLNLLIIPGLVYVVRLEKRIYALELILKMRIEALPCWKTAGSCNHVESTS